MTAQILPDRWQKLQTVSLASDDRRMTADEIRKLRDDSVGCRVDGTLDEQATQAYMLGEIAAQLAEIKEVLKMIVPKP